MTTDKSPEGVQDEAPELALARRLDEIAEANEDGYAMAGAMVIRRLYARVQELERERNSYKRACDEWTEKTEWVQRTVRPHELGMHRADALADRIARAIVAGPADQESALDSERLDWLAAQTRNSCTGIGFDWCAHVEDGQVLERGYRFMRRAFLGARCRDFRAAIDAARGAQGESNGQ